MSLNDTKIRRLKPSDKPLKSLVHTILIFSSTQT
jgi:hypothetical protein